MLKLLAAFEFAVAALLLGVIVVLVFFAAVLRFFDHPLIWSVDMAQLLFIWLCMIGATRALRSKSHIGIDLFVRFLPRAARFWLEIVLSVVILVFLGMLVYQGIMLTLGNLPRRFGDSGLSYGWVTAAVPTGAVLLSISLLYNMWTAWQNRGDGKSLVYSRSESDAATPTEL